MLQFYGVVPPFFGFIKLFIRSCLLLQNHIQCSSVILSFRSFKNSKPCNKLTWIPLMFLLKFRYYPFLISEICDHKANLFRCNEDGNVKFSRNCTNFALESYTARYWKSVDDDVRNISTAWLTMFNFGLSG
jgi:hypothetical protein